MARPSNTAERRDQIIDGLITTMATHGYDGASTARIAKAAALSSGLVHYHFSKKQDILLAAIEKLSAQHEAALDKLLTPASEAAAASDATDGAMARIERFINAHVGLHATPNPEVLAVWVMLSGEAIRHPEVRDPFEHAITQTAKRLRGLISDAWPPPAKRGERIEREGAIDDAVGAIMAAIEGYYVLACTARSIVPKGSAAKCVITLAHALIPASAGGAQ